MFGTVGSGVFGAEAERSLHAVGAVGYHDGRVCYCLPCSPFNRLTAGIASALYPEDGEFRCCRCAATINARPAAKLAERLRVSNDLISEAAVIADATGWSDDRAVGYCFGRLAKRSSRPFLALDESAWRNDRSDFAVGYRHGYGRKAA